MELRSLHLQVRFTAPASAAWSACNAQPKTICKKVWVPTCEQKEVQCVRIRSRECRDRCVPYTVKCRNSVPECRQTN